MPIHEMAETDVSARSAIFRTWGAHNPKPHLDSSEANREFRVVGRLLVSYMSSNNE